MLRRATVLISISAVFLVAACAQPSRALPTAIPTSPPLPTATPTPSGEVEYQAGLQAQKNGRLWDAYQQFEKAITLNPSRQDAVAQLYDVDQRLRKPIYLVSDLTHWRASAKPADGWSTSLDFNESAWLPPVLGEIDSDVPRLSNGDTQYIWKSEQTGSGDDAYFRSEVDLAKVPYSAAIAMNVDDEYDLYVNGKLVGSDHASDGWKTVETYDVANDLHAGRNLIAIHGHNVSGAYSFAFNMKIEQMGPRSAVVDKALSTFPTPTVTPTVTSTSTNTPTPTSTPTQTPTSTPTPNISRLKQTVDAAWANKDWPTVISALETLHSADPNSKEHKDKLYAAYLNYGKQLVAKGDKQGAATQFSKAIDLDRPRPEARAALSALTPTPTPMPPTSTPTAGPWISDAVETGGLALTAGNLNFRQVVGYTQADSGKEFVIVEVALKNVSTSRKSYNEFGDFKLKDGSGNIRGPVGVIGLGNEIQSGQLDPGGTVDGWVPFQITKGDRDLTLVFDPCLLFCGEKEVPLQETYRLR